tara:strand:+ start:4192 stop:5169 length:978 start_codon:yes stop_codon:yes gene_type:complete
MCLYPRLIRNRKYTVTKKNGGVIPPINDERVTKVAVGCGKCMECRKQKARQWQVRLQEDMRANKNGKFVTWTFSDEGLKELDKEIKGLSGYERDNEITRLAVRRYTERWRKKYGKTLRHWIVTEIGGTRTERIHMHGIVWTDEKEDIEKIWKYGKVWIGEYVSERTVNYIVKYVNKVDEKHKEYSSKIYTSKGIGKGYLERNDSKRNKYKEVDTKETYVTREGVELALPIYYRNKIYSDDEKEKLWIEKLDKEERWVCGVRVDVSETDEEYYKLLKIKRKLNKRLGYGDDKINWDRKQYEKERRNMKRRERIEKIWNTNAGKNPC